MSDIIQIDTVRALTLLRDVVAEVGSDHIYRHPDGTVASDRHKSPCMYQVDGCPACIIGHALRRAGVPIDVLRGWDDEGTGTSISVAESEGLDIDEDARAVLCAAQDQQDGGRTWGAALVQAERVAQDLADARQAMREAGLS